MFLGRPQLTHKVAHITCKRGVYYYRRRLPRPLNGEIGLSLRTPNYREAQYLSSLLDQRLWAALRQHVAGSADAMNLTQILREELERELRSRWRDYVGTPMGQSVFNAAWEPADGDSLKHDLAMMDDAIASTTGDIQRRSYGGVEDWADEIAARNSIPDAQGPELMMGLLHTRLEAERAQRQWLLGGAGPSDGISQGSSLGKPAESLAPSPTPNGPPLSEIEDAFIAAMQRKKVKPWQDDDVRKARSVYRLFREWCGDKSLADYRRSEVYDFYRALAMLPSNHGKSPADQQRTMQERIDAAAEADDVKRLSAKTMEGYATRLITLFEHHRDEDDQNWINPASEFTKFEELGEASMSRKMWEGEPLKTLLAAPVWTGGHSEHLPREPGPKVFANERYWLPILALYHGARLEELARLVRDEVREESGIPYLVITDDAPAAPDGAKVVRKKRVKSDAAKRRVPLHQAVLDLGFLDYVRHIAPNSGDFIFPRLKANPNKGHMRSGKFSQWFTAYRRDMGVEDPCYVFHSFRAGVATKLLGAPGVPIGHVVALIGHEHEIAKAAKAQTLFSNYFKPEQIPLADLKQTIDRVSFPEAALRRPTVYSDGAPFFVL